MLAGLLVGIFGMMTLVVMKLAIANAHLRSRLLVAETKSEHQDEKLTKQADDIAELLRRTTPKELTQEQKEFKETLELKWKTAMDELTKDLTAKLKKDSGKLDGMVEKQKADFEAAVHKAFKEACDKITFDKIEYKKTITKKRGEYARKNKGKAVPQKVYRSIDDE